MELKICFVAQLNMIDFIWPSSLLFRRVYTRCFYGAKLFWKTTRSEARLTCAAAGDSQKMAGGPPPKHAKDGSLMITVGWPFRCLGPAHSEDLLHVLGGAPTPCKARHNILAHRHFW